MRQLYSILKHSITTRSGWLVRFSGLVVLWLLAAVLVSGCRDSIETKPNPGGPATPVARPLLLKVHMNQQHAFTLADSLQLSSTYTQTIGSSTLGTFSPHQNSSTVTFVPRADTVGSEQVSYTVCYDGRCASSYITVSIQDPANCRLAARTDTMRLVDADSASINLAANDDTCQGSRFTLVGQPQFGTATLTAKGKLLYFMSSGQALSDQITYTLSAPGKVPVTAQVVIKVSSSCTLDANPDVFLVLAGMSRELNVLHNDLYCLGTRVVIESMPRGQLTVLGNGRFRYSGGVVTQPNDAFRYHLEYGRFRSASTTVLITTVQPCVSSVPPSLLYNLDANNGDLLDFRNLNTQTLRICQHTDIRFLNINVGMTGVQTIQQGNGRILIDRSGMSTTFGTISIEYEVLDTLLLPTATPQRGRLDVLVNRPLCRGTQSLPTTSATDLSGRNDGVEIDAQQLLQNANLNCRPIISNAIPAVVWTIPNQLVRSNLNVSHSRIRLTKVNATSYYNGVIGYTLNLVDFNGNVMGQATGSVRVTIN